MRTRLRCEDKMQMNHQLLWTNPTALHISGLPGLHFLYSLIDTKPTTTRKKVKFGGGGEQGAEKRNIQEHMHCCRRQEPQQWQ